MGYLHVNSSEVQLEEGKQYLFVTMDCTSKLAFAVLHPHAIQAIAVVFLERVLARISYLVHQVLTCDGIQSRNMPYHTHLGRHPLGRLCDE